MIKSIIKWFITRNSSEKVIDEFKRDPDFVIFTRKRPKYYGLCGWEIEEVKVVPGGIDEHFKHQSDVWEYKCSGWEVNDNT